MNLDELKVRALEGPEDQGEIHVGLQLGWDGMRSHVIVS